MTDPAANPQPLPEPPSLPLTVVSIASEAMVDMPQTTADATASARTGSQTRWLADVAAPFALGLACALSWVGAAILAAQGGLPFVEARSLQGALLLLVPVSVIIMDIALNHDNIREPGRSQSGGALRVLLTLAVIVVGLAFAFLATSPLPPENNLGILFLLPFAAPGFSIGVALGYAWGAWPRPAGAGAGLMGGLGFAAPMAALAALLIVMSRQPPIGCGGKIGCGLQQPLDQLLAILLLAACVLTISLGFIGGIMGAFFRGR